MASGKHGAVHWNDLTFFLAVAREGSLTAAAQTLKTSPATVGRRIAALEELLGAHLFDRRQSGYLLSQAGTSLLKTAEIAEEAVLSFEREALGQDVTPSGVVRLAVTDDMAAYVIGPNLGELQRRHPDIRLEIASGVGLTDLYRREADIALRATRPEQSDLIIRRIGKVDFALYASRSYVKAKRLRPGLQELSDLSVITWTEDLAHLTGGPWFAAHAPSARVALTATSPRVQMEACKAGLGLAILPCFAGDSDPNLVCLLGPDQVLSLDNWVVVHRDIARTPRIRAVMDFLVSLAPRLGRQASL